MTDDELIVLWSLAGMELWSEFKNRDVLPYAPVWAPLSLTVCFNINLIYLSLWSENEIRERCPHVEVLYSIDDILSFNPNERWWKLLFAKRWYEKNKEQFHD